MRQCLARFESGYSHHREANATLVFSHDKIERQ